MVSVQLDFLTLEFLTSRDIEISQALNNVLDILHLGDLWDNFLYVGRDRFFESVYRYNDISILICREGKLLNQGICVRFSGNGVAFYCNHLARKGETLRRVLRAWRSSAVNGDFTRCTRVDVAMDDIHKGGSTPLLTMRKIRNCVKNREFRSRLRTNRPVFNQVIEVSEDFSSKADDLQGDTIYFGKRRSVVVVRFYDKLLEQRYHNNSIDGDISSWVRCELECHGSRAAAVFNNYCDMTDDVFGQEVAANINNYVCFIKKDDINRSRCSVKRWWLAFIGSLRKARLSSPPYKPSTFRGNIVWFKNISPSIYALIRIVGLRYFLNMINEYGKDRLSARHKQLENDFLHCFMHQTDILSDDSSEKTCVDLGLDYWCMTSKKSKYQAMRDMQEDYKRFRTVNGFEWKEFTDKPDKGVQLAMCGNRSVYVDDEWYEAFCKKA